MLEMGTSGLMSGEGKRAAASRPRTALFLDSTQSGIYWRKQAKLPAVTSARHGNIAGCLAPNDRVVGEVLSISAVAARLVNSAPQWRRSLMINKPFSHRALSGCSPTRSR